MVVRARTRSHPRPPVPTTPTRTGSRGSPSSWTTALADAPSDAARAAEPIRNSRRPACAGLMARLPARSAEPLDPTPVDPGEADPIGPPLPQEPRRTVAAHRQKGGRPDLRL